ncbi:DUF6588 family protein [Rufibacter ruber]|uniref:DUF6588 family protein n=1 Tax=Rufibacter ruber TaxID=1783499 RepID=UPI000AEBC821|nr:DUF6588 family protein [Rufibacter ruber]
MRKSLLKKVLWALPVVGLFLALPSAQAQDEVGDFIRANQSDANKLIKAYADPVGKALGHSLNGGWFNSGKAMGLGRFDIRIFGTATFAPDEAKTFDLATLGLSDQVVVSGKSTTAPTFFGRDEDGPELTIYAKTRTPAGVEIKQEVASFNSPPGSGIDILPFPIAQLSVGLIKDTEIAVRFVPNTKFDDFEAGLWGVGLKHGIKQWIPVLSKVPGFDITVFGGYTNLKSAYRGIEVTPEAADNPSAAQSAPGYYDGQGIELTTKAWTASLVASKTLSVITGYAGMKYSNVQTDLTAVGRYPVPSIRSTPPYQRYVEDITEPIDVSMKDSQFGLNAGLRLKLAFFSIYGEYTFAKYSTAMAGIGFGWN